MDAEMVAPKFKKLMGDFAEVTAMPGNRLVLQGTVGNLKIVLKEVEEGEKSIDGSFFYVCKWKQVHDAERILRRLLAITTERTSSAFGRTETGKPICIVTDEGRNLILIAGPADVVAKARDLIENKIDRGGVEPLSQFSKPIFQTYRIPAGNAKALVKELQALHPAGPNLRITAEGDTTIRVYGTPEDQDTIKQKIDQDREKHLKSLFIDIGTLDPADTVKKLIDMLGDATKDNNPRGAPYISAMPAAKGIMVRGTPDQIEEVRDIIKAMQDGGANLRKKPREGDNGK
jgi:hypothetical protein